MQNHLILPKDDKEAIIEITKTLSEECKKRDIAITGGETSIQNNIDGMDLSVTISGFIKKIKVNKFHAGDVLIGIKSNGLHSNGFTKIREIFKNKFMDEFVKPTLIYSDYIKNLERNYDIHGLMHITGGAFTKLKDILSKDDDVVITRNHFLCPHSIFKELYNGGISDEEMYETFNCGIGFILSSSGKNSDKIVSLLNSNLNADIIGEVVYGKGKVRLESMFSNKEIEF